MDQAPVPLDGVLAESAIAYPAQPLRSVPAFAVVGAALLVSTTSSADAVQGALLMVQRRVALLPAGTPVTVEVGEEGVVIVAVPLTTLQLPVPTVAVLPANVNEPLLQFD